MDQINLLQSDLNSVKVLRLARCIRNPELSLPYASEKVL
jgi:aryl carrier-like protein